MSLLQGTISLRRFMVLGPVPTNDNLLERLQHNAFQPFRDGIEEERIGWCDWRNLLIVPPDGNWVHQEKFALFGLRIDTRKVPAILLKAHIDLKIESLQKNNSVVFINKETRASLRDEVHSELLLKVLPTPKILEVAWDLKGGLILTTASSGRAQSAFTSLFIKTFGCELQEITPLLMASRLLPGESIDSLMALSPLDLTVETI